MNIIENIIHKLSKKENRVFFIVILFFFFIIVAIPLYNTFHVPFQLLHKHLTLEYFLSILSNPSTFIARHVNYELSNIIDYFEIIIVFFTIWFLYKKTSKSEINRYKENYKFYADTYSNLKKYILKIGSIQSSSIDYSSQVSLELSNIKLMDIKFILDDCDYTLPFLIEEQARTILIDKFNIQSKNDYNGLTLALKKIKEIKGKKSTLEFRFCQSEYFKYLLTNMLPEYEILPELTIRELLESSSTKGLNTLETSLAENHLGISSLISINININNNNQSYFIIPKRTENTTVFKGNLSPSVSGAANIHTCQSQQSSDTAISIENFFRNELNEELGSLIDDLLYSPIKRQSSERIEQFIENSKRDDYLIQFGVHHPKRNEYIDRFIEDANLIGISRELKRLGKPELFFYYDSKITLHEKHLEKIEIKGTDATTGAYYIFTHKDKSRGNIDTHENEKFLLVPVDNIELYLSLKEIKTASKSSYNKIEIYTELFENFRVSESLLVNIIYAKKYREKYHENTIRTQ